ncbi:MAG TPA: histidine phosphatase family protein [Candidatus Dormibacteraeota bacterium]|jgi:probable phosphoglycerate mutase|nr:histidine phosphatase family protein [Candidatus Dormibacteraeota bacterium]
MSTAANGPTPRIAVHLVRHGESTWNVARLVQGQSPRAGSLTARGRAQARRIAEELAALASARTVLLSSDLPRARDTAAAVAARTGLPLRLDARLREQDLGILEGRPLAEEFDGDTVEAARERLWHDPERRAPGGESVLDMYGRVIAALRSAAILMPGRDLVVVTHGGPVRAVTAAALAGVVLPMQRRPVRNASVTTISLDALGVAKDRAAVAAGAAA